MDFASQNLTAGQLNAIVKTLGGEEEALKLLRGELIVSTPDPSNLPVWKTLRRGGKSTEELLTALSDGGYKVSDWARDLMSKGVFTDALSTDTEKVKVGKVTPRELGFTKMPTTDELYERFASFGFTKLPPDIGAEARLVYDDQPSGEWTKVYMDPITVSDGYRRVFYVAHDSDGLWLLGSDAYPVSQWDLDRPWLVGFSK